MNPDDEYRAWLNARRGESPPMDLTDRIMSAVRESVTPRPIKESSKTAWQRVIPYFVCSAAALVLAARIYSFLSPFLIPSSITDVAIIEPSQEISHER